LRRVHRALAFHAAVGRHRVGAGNWSKRHLGEVLAERQVVQARLDAITSTRAYRAARLARRALQAVRG
jgi:hypothetical protein